MKYLLSTCLFFISICAISQDCKTYFYLQNNKTIEVTVYNKIGEVSGKQVYTVSDYKNTAGTSSAILNTEVFDKKGKSVGKSSGVVKCTKGVRMMDMKMSMPPGQPLGITDAKAENLFIEYPVAMNTGDNLKDGHMEIETDSKGMKQSITLDVINRKVEGKKKLQLLRAVGTVLKLQTIPS